MSPGRGVAYRSSGFPEGVTACAVECWADVLATFSALAVLTGPSANNPQQVIASRIFSFIFRSP